MFRAQIAVACSCALAILYACGGDPDPAKGAPGGDAGPSQDADVVDDDAGAEGGADAKPPTDGGKPDAEPPLAKGIRFALIGDYGVDDAAESAVAQLVIAESPEFVVTLGDNNYPEGLASTIDDNIGKYYQSFIHPYVGSHGPGATENRFWPCLGNHDWQSGTMKPYADYFVLPGNERYWDLIKGSVHFVCLDSDPHEPDGRTINGGQGSWFQQRMAGSTAPFRLVVMHHPPYSSGEHGNTSTMQWPYAQHGADAVLAGHDHNYERLAHDGIPYVVQGLGGAGLRAMATTVPQSIFTFNTAHGATFARADDHFVVFESKTTDKDLVDLFSVASRNDESVGARALLAKGATWSYLDDGSAPAPAWKEPSFDASAWKSGAAQLGYGHASVKTTVSYGASSSQKYITTYFRSTFDVAKVDDIAWLEMRIQKDDGAVVYVNGVEVHRTNLPSGSIDSNTTARFRVGHEGETAWEPVALDASAITKGTNVIAVEVHQVGATSSDLMFDLSIDARLK